MTTRGPRYETFGDLVDAHQTDIHRYLRWLTASGHEADDLFQETFLRALKAYARLSPNANHRAWLYRIATNAFLNTRRAEARHREVPLPDEVAGSRGSPTARHEARAMAVACSRAIGALPRRQRAAFVQRRLMGLSYREVAAASGGTEAAARANVYQAVKRLRRALFDD